MVTSNNNIESKSIVLAPEDVFPSFIDFITPKKSVAIPISNVKAISWVSEKSGELLVIESHGPTVKVMGSKLRDLKKLLIGNRVLEIVEDHQAAFDREKGISVSKIIFEDSQKDDEKMEGQSLTL